MARYAAADLFVFPSIWDEGYGLPPVEAMAAGVPVVASRSGAVAQTVVDGETGFLVDKNDSAGLAAAMTRLLDDPDLRATMGERGRRRALDLYTWARSAESARALYDIARSPRSMPAEHYGFRRVATTATNGVTDPGAGRSTDRADRARRRTAGARSRPRRTRRSRARP